MFINIHCAKAQITSALDGTASQVDISGNRIDISGGRLSSDRANLFHSFEEFGLTSEQIANFQVDVDIQNVLGRIVGGNASIIDGLIQVTGGDANLYLMNPAGIVFGANAQLNVSGDFTATTATSIGIDDQWFHSVGEVQYDSLVGSPSQFAFTDFSVTTDGHAFGSIVNMGDLALEPTQHLMLLGGLVINAGTLQVPGGTITVAAVPNDNLVRISQENMVLNLEMTSLEQEAGESVTPINPVPFSPLSLPELLTAGGPDAAADIQVLANGNIQLTGSELEVPLTDGTTIASQTIDTSSSLPITDSSTIQVLGEAIAVINGNITASGPEQGGRVYIGGNFQGQGPLPNAERLFIDKGSHLEASTFKNGDGGTVIVWADQSTQFYGTIDAHGGSQTGNGGFVEISGEDWLDFQGTVDTTALNGATGTLLLDPRNIRIVAPGDETVNSSATFVVFSDEPPTTTIASDTIESATTDVILQANNDIVVDDDIDTTANGNTPSLTLQAGRSIDINASIRLQDGSFIATINDEDADPVQREQGVATFSLAPGQIIETIGAGNVSIEHGTFESTHLSSFDSGEIVLEGDLITDSGDITLNGTGGVPINGEIASQGIGVTIFDANIQTDTGTITINGVGGGTTTGTAPRGTGVWINSSSTVEAVTSGALNLQGTGGNGENDNSGIQVDGSLSINNGSLTLEGHGGGFADGNAVPGSGILLNSGSQIELINSTATLTGFSGAGNSSVSVAGIDASDFNLTLDDSNVTFDGQYDHFLNGQHAGISLERGFINDFNDSSLTISGAVKQGDGIGVYLADTTINASDITIDGIGDSTDFDMSGVDIQNSTISADNDLLITGDANAEGINVGDSNISTVIGTLQLTTNNIRLDNAVLGGSDVLHIQPLDANHDISLVEIAGTGAGLELDRTELAAIEDGFSEIQIGRADGTGVITAIGDVFFPAPVLLQSPQDNGRIDTAAASLSSHHSLGNGSIEFLADGDIIVRDLSTGLTLGIGEEEPIVDGDGPMSTGINSVILNTRQGITVQGMIDVSSTDAIDGGSIVLEAGETIQITEEGFLNASGVTDRGPEQDGGIIQLTSGSDIVSRGFLQAAALNVDGDAGSGGVVTIRADGTIQLADIDVSSHATNGLGGEGGLISLEAGQAIAIDGLLDTSSQSDGDESGSGGAITAAAIDDLSWFGNWDTTSEANNIGGDVTLTSESGRLLLSLFTADNDSDRQSGAVTLTAQNNLSLDIEHIGAENPVLSSTGSPIALTSNNGAIQITSTTGTPFTLATEGASLSISGTDLNLANVNFSTASAIEPGGELTLQASTGAIATGNLDSSGTSGGNINVLATTAITTGAIDASGSQSNGGNVLLDPSGDIQVGFINTEGGVNGVGGKVDITTESLFRATDTFMTQDGQVASISSNGGQGSGDIIIRYGSGMDTPFIIGESMLHGTAGIVTTGSNTLVAGESFLGAVTRGNIKLETVGDTSDNPSAPNTIEPLATADTLSSTPQVSTDTPSSNQNNPSNSTAPNSPSSQRPNEPNRSQDAAFHNLQTPLIGLLSQSHPLVQTEGQHSAPHEADGNFSSGFEQHVAMDSFAIELESMGDLEEGIVDDFSNHFELPVVAPIVSVGDAQNTLRQIQSHTGVSPAVIYAQFVSSQSPSALTNEAKNNDLLIHGSDQLELMVVSSAGLPTRIRVDGATRNKVERVVRQFQNDITNPARRHSDRYLASAQTLHQWLIAPIEATLIDEGIENIAFVLDNGLRSLPMAALHDGERFLIEKYSVGMMPSLSLTDTRYVDTRDLGILAMGASEFEQQAPLPAVPVELAAITEDIWQNGEYFLNKDFTIENLKAQRQEQPYGIVHLATHGEFRAGTPENSYLQLGDRTLHLNELRELGLNDPTVELLVLSACRTALGDDSAELGFAGLALQAGVKSVMASLWYVSDAGALGLTTEFYRQLRETPIKAEALRQAQLAMIRGDIALDGNVLRSIRGGNINLPEAVTSEISMDLSHPFYWSAFTMVGSPW
ncbi:MAG: CHAT domain-containing protein [Cyanobacteria bacterium P01_F01_bin.150]